jgi:hypothetical protein
MTAVLVYVGMALIFAGFGWVLYRNHEAELARRRLIRTLDQEAAKRVERARRG